MVKVNLSKFLQLIDALNSCPVGIPNRVEKLFDIYEKNSATSDYVVSLHVSANLERLKESYLDSEESKRKMAIFSELIETLTNKPISIPCCNESKIYLVSPLVRLGILITWRVLFLFVFRTTTMIVFSNNI